MKITAMRIGGIAKPLGFDMPRVTISWKVEEAASAKAAWARICVAADADFSQILYEKEGEALKSIGERAAIELTPRTRYHVRVEVRGDRGDSATGVTWFETGKMGEPWQGKWIGTAKEDAFHPLFMRDIDVAGDVACARLYATGLGLYEAYVNGEKAGDELLTPLCNDYGEHVQVQTYDVTALLRRGQNRLEIACGNGWYKGRLGYEGARAVYGDRFAALAELHVTLEDGTHAVYATDESWQYRGSDIESSDIYDGECINRLLWQGRENADKAVELLEGKALIDRYSLPVRVMDSLPVREVISTPAGETVLDMGQNFTGYMEFDADFPAGTKIVLDHGEILQNGNFYNDNYRTARAQMIYISDGRRETVRAHFTFFGFRYVRVTGWPGELPARAFTGRVVYSALDAAMRFECGNDKLNRLAKNALWGQRSNFLDMPTDCPQRDERLGWTGDAQVFAPTASFQMDTRAFYRKFLTDLRLDQVKHGGVVANYLPNFSGMPGGSSVWGDIATFLPVTLYDYYGDEGELAAHYPMMRDWVDWIYRQDEEKGGQRLWNFGFHFGDWLAQDGATPQSMKGGTDDFFVASMYYYASARKAQRVAGILQYEQDEARFGKLAGEIYDAIVREYFSPNGRLCVDTQTAYLLCLNFGVYKDRARVLEALKSRLQRDCYKIRGGFVGATMMCRVLAENGMAELAAYLLFQEGFPGWMHCINLGATTIWERWNSVLDDGSISGTGMNSLNHYAYGSVMEYVYRDLAGIQPLEPGFTRVRFAPQPTWRAGFMSCAYDSAQGVYASAWRINADGTLSVRFEVPFGGAATARLPGTDEEIELTAGVFEKTYCPGRDYGLKYTMDSRLDEMKDDAQALEILKEDLPPAYSVIIARNEEFMAQSLEELQYLFFHGFNPGLVHTGTQRLFKLKA